jgi:hypothetical protein
MNKLVISGSLQLVHEDSDSDKPDAAVELLSDGKEERLSGIGVV